MQVQPLDAQDVVVPDRVQVGAHHAVDVVLARIGLGLEVGAQAHLEPVAAQVVAVAGVHRLVRIADEMHQELQRVASCFQRLRAIGQDRLLRLDRADHAVAAVAVARRHVIAAALGIIHVVPLRSRLEPIRILVAQRVRPVGDAGQARVVLAGEEPGDLRRRHRVEVCFGQLARQPVAQRTPRLGGGGRHEGQQAEQQRAEEQQETGIRAHGGMKGSDGTG